MTTRTVQKAPAEVMQAVPIRRLDPERGIQSVEDLADHLYVAAQVELSTIPMYLYSTYSIKTHGHSQWAAPRGALRSMVGISIEEMLHLALVRNLLVGIGYGDMISFYDKDFIPKYPSKMLNRYNTDDPDGAEITLNLSRLSPDSVKTFRRVEMPDKVKPDVTTYAEHPEAVGQYTSLGEFYRAIEDGFVRLDKKIKWAKDDVRYQYKRGFWNEFGNGKPIRVFNLATARKALNIIIEQGEGTTSQHKYIKLRPGVEDYTHYEKFLRIERGEEGFGVVDGVNDQIRLNDPKAIGKAVWPVVANPTVDRYKDQPGIHSLMTLFNAAYCYTLCILDEVYEHTTDDVEWKKLPGTDREERFSERYGLERNNVAIMEGILYPLAQLLVSTPIPGGPDKGQHAGPSFEFYDFDADTATSSKQQLIKLCDEAIDHFPALGGPDGVRRQITLLADV